MSITKETSKWIFVPDVEFENVTNIRFVFSMKIVNDQAS